MLIDYCLGGGGHMFNKVMIKPCKVMAPAQ